MAITNAERAYLKSKMIDLVEEYDYQWTDNGIETVIDTWNENNRTLIEAFKKHPNYVEGKFMIAFDTDYEREISKRPSQVFSEWLRGRLMAGTVEIPTEIEEQRAAEGCTYLPGALFNFLWWLENYAERVISEATATHLNNIVPAIHAHTGQKTSRVINKLCTYLGFAKLPDYNKEFAKYADSLNPLKITRHTILSINPLDYLTMSFGNSWASCHTIDKRNKRGMPYCYSGEYSSGTMSYMLDGTSMVFYTVDGAYNGDEYYFQPKITRQMFHYGEDKLIQSRLYPQNNDGAVEIYTQYRNLVQQIMSEIFEFPNLWVVGKGADKASKYIDSHGTHYEDYHYVSYCTLSQIKGSENEEHIDVGHDPICIECGYEHAEEDNINCCRSQGNGYYCADCGDWIDEDHAIYCDGEYYCHDCVRYCDYCEEYHVREEYYTEYVGYNGGYICEYCKENHFYYCEDCHELISEDEIYYIDGEDKHVCEDCRDNYEDCIECGETYRREHMNEYNGRCYCNDCFEDLEIEENEAV